MAINNEPRLSKDNINFTMPNFIVPNREVELQRENQEPTIVDYYTPLVVMFGPPACGKTMTLVRLTRYLQNRGYTVQPILSFYPPGEMYYKERCIHFESMIESKDVTVSHLIGPLLVRISSNEKNICQILDVPGEFCFDSTDRQGRYIRGIMDSIIKLRNRKIWLLMVNPSQSSFYGDRVRYADVLRQLKTKMNPRDKVIFIFNKIDETPFVFGPGNIKYGLALKHTEFLYPNIFVPFRNVNPLTKWWKPNNFDFIVFHTGDFSQAADGTLTFEEGHDIYPQKLWNYIQKRIRG